LSTLSDIRDVVRRSESIEEYTPASVAAWDEAWERFQTVCRG